MTFNVIPVLDIKEGRAVHAVGGTRDFYQPLKTILHQGCRPIEIARAYRDRLQLGSLYLADLDAIAGSAPNFRLYESLVDEGCDLLLDAGFRDLFYADALTELSGLTLVVGLESIQGPVAARAILDRVGPDRVVFSVDQSEGHPLIASPNAWGTETSAGIADRVIELGFERLLLLDLARVGTGRGPETNPPIAHLRRNHPLLSILVGGGISGMADIRQLQTEGASGVLVGSALHDGRIGLRELTL